jgi:hypothetical protein
MLKDTNLSTILLLGVLLFLIYCLMNQPNQSAVVKQEVMPKITVSKKSPSVKDDTFDNSENEELENEDEEIVNENEEDVNESFQNNEDYDVTGINESEVDNFAPNIETFADSDISPDVVEQLISESNKKSVPLNSPLLQSQRNEVNNFAPSDDQASSGASLDAAFERPVADTTNTDVIDLQKNNVKNYNSKDYLPKEVNDDWFNTDFSQAKYKMNDDKLINTDKYIIGINTVGQSLKNASYDIRGAVNVPKYTVSPWNNSTIEPDYNIKPLC